MVRPNYPPKKLSASQILSPVTVPSVTNLAHSMLVLPLQAGLVAHRALAWLTGKMVVRVCMVALLLKAIS